MQQSTPSQRFIVRPWIVVTLLCVTYLTFVYVRYNKSVREFIWPTPSGEQGYDGQFTYAIASNPLNAAAKLDVPGYRYQRILHPVLARVLALGSEALIPWTILLINVVALSAGTAALEHLLRAERVSGWYALSYGLFGGVLGAVRASTTEPLAYGLVLLAILAERRGRLVWSAVLLMLAALAKETTLFFTAGYVLYFVLEKRWREAILLTLVVGVPFAALQLVLLAWLGQAGVGSGGAMATPFTPIPFGGVIELFNTAINLKIAGFLLIGALLIAFTVLPTLWALWRGGQDTLRRRWHPYVFLLLANAAIMPFVPFSTYREPFGISRFLAGLIIGVLLYAALRRSRRVLLNATLWLMFGLVVILSG